MELPRGNNIVERTIAKRRNLRRRGAQRRGAINTQKKSYDEEGKPPEADTAHGAAEERWTWRRQEQIPLLKTHQLIRV